MQWVILFVAGLFEVAFAVGLKMSNGLSRPWVTVASGACVLVSMTLLAVSLKHLPVGTAYAVWTGIGSIGTAALGMLIFNEPATAMRLVFISLIVAGIAGLKFVTP